MFWGKITFLAGDFGTEEFYLEKNKDKLKNAKKLFGGIKLSISEIIECNIETQESVKNFGRTLGAAALGGALFAGAGAVVGSVAGGNATEYVVSIKTIDGRIGLARIDNKAMDRIRVHLFELQNGIKKAEKPKKKSKFWKILLIVIVIVLIAALFGEDTNNNQNAQISNDQQVDLKANSQKKSTLRKLTE